MVIYSHLYRQNTGICRLLFFFFLKSHLEMNYDINIMHGHIILIFILYEYLINVINSTLET